MRSSARDAIIAHARAEAPLECCGLLLGATGVVEEACRTRNVRRSQTAYLVDPADHFAAIRKARRSGQAILGAYHSHPRAPAVPSPTDLQEAWNAGFLYVIVSLADREAPDVRGYYLEANVFVHAPVVIIP
jgi:proteasome lid subunit RPN8/RPN11